MYTITKRMNDLVRCMNRYRAEQLAPLELKSCHAGYLLEICACPGISQEQLSRRIYANKSNVAGSLSDQERQRLTALLEDMTRRAEGLLEEQ